MQRLIDQSMDTSSSAQVQPPKPSSAQVKPSMPSSAQVQPPMPSSAQVHPSMPTSAHFQVLHLHKFNIHYFMSDAIIYALEFNKTTTNAGSSTKTFPRDATENKC